MIVEEKVQLFYALAAFVNITLWFWLIFFPFPCSFMKFVLLISVCWVFIIFYKPLVCVVDLCHLAYR